MANDPNIDEALSIITSSLVFVRSIERVLKSGADNLSSMPEHTEENIQDVLFSVLKATHDRLDGLDFSLRDLENLLKKPVSSS